MNEEKKSVKIIMGDASTVSALTFTTLCFLFFANYFGWLGTTGGLCVGLFQLCVFPMYAYGGITSIQNGDSYTGIIYIVFAAFFGAVGGGQNLAGAICGMLGIDYSWQTLGWIFLIIGLWVLAIVPTTIHAPVSFFALFLCGGLACTTWGLAYMAFLPDAINSVLLKIGLWAVLISGILGFLGTVSAMYGFMGVKVTYGFLSKPLIPIK